jgi:hypothetical protein
MNGRRKYQRPQGMLWSENPGTITSGVVYPDFFETGSNLGGSQNPDAFDNFIILSDDNRDAINFEIDRIEKRERMINGRTRSYHIADKLRISTSWSMLPSRSYSSNPDFLLTSGKSSLGSSSAGLPSGQSAQYTTDGGAGGVDLLNWYENHKGPFWVFLAYDKRTNFESDQYSRLQQYNEVVEMYISDFSYSVEKRNSSYDFWNISVTLEEV